MKPLNLITLGLASTLILAGLVNENPVHAAEPSDENLPSRRIRTGEPMSRWNSVPWPS